jgi:hypothetical protein
VIWRLVFYLIEAAFLSLIASVGVAFSINALVRLGAPVRLRYGRVLLILWLVLSGIGIGFGEAIGPEFTFAYFLSGSIAVGGALTWMISFFARGAYFRAE